MDKKKILLAALIVMILAVLVQGSLAYSNYEERAKNVISSNTEGIDVEIEEFGPNEEAFVDVEKAMPGVSYDKHVKVKNTTSNEAYVRARVTVSIQRESEEEATVLAYDVENKRLGDGTLVDIDFDTEKWSYADGWWVYQSKLGDKQMTDALFDYVTMVSSMDNSYQGSTVLVKVEAQAVQAAFNDEMTGWPEE